MAEKQIANMNALKKIIAVGAILLSGLVISGCRPMYGQTSLGSSAIHEMASIDIKNIPGRVGQQIRNELVFQFTGGNSPAQPKYKLEVVYRSSTLGVLFKRTSDAAGRIYSLDATYTLRDLSGKNILTQGKSHARAGFDKVKSGYSNVRAERDAENRAAKDVASDINTRLAAYISSSR